MGRHGDLLLSQAPPLQLLLSDRAASDAAVRRRVLEALPGPTGDEELDAFSALQRDYPSRAGKGLRGRLVLLSAAAHGATGPEEALTVAAALELFQAWVLVHDDVEDASEERRGGPTLHRMVGDAVAINVGDAMHVHMWRLLHSLLEGPGGQRAPRVLAEFSDMVTRTASGQHLDLTWVADDRFDIGEQEYLHMVTLKTAWYTVASPLRLGALIAGGSPEERLSSGALKLGAAFQIRDDVLNLSSADGSGYGKEPLGDIFEGKRTLLVAHLLSRADEDERDYAVGVLATARADTTIEEAQRVLELMRLHGSLAHAQAVARRLASEGLEELEAALSGAPDQESVARLLLELEAVAERAS